MKSCAMRVWMCMIAFCVQLLGGEQLNPHKKALIFGVTGQDGSYLSEFLLNKGYEVYGVQRRSSSPNTVRIDHLLKWTQNGGQFYLLYGDVTDAAAIFRLIAEVHPDEIYNLAAQSHVLVSFDLPEYTAQTNAIGALNILEAIRALRLIDQVKFYQASSSELYGLVQESPQTEKTPFYPRSPYAIAKLYAYWATINYREALGMFACNGILFNHESPLRGETFVTRKVTLGACRYKLGLQDVLYLGNLDARRDWGYAKDYVEAMWLIMQQDSPDDYVIASGENHSVREFVELAFKELDIEIEWRGKGISEYGIDKSTGKAIIKIDPQYYRPTDVEYILGNAEKAKKKFNWTPRTNFKDLVRIMIESDYQVVLTETVLRNLSMASIESSFESAEKRLC